MLSNSAYGTFLQKFLRSVLLAWIFLASFFFTIAKTIGEEMSIAIYNYFNMFIIQNESILQLKFYPFQAISY